jgi:putative photosynthetic complex assembly protein
MSSTSHAGPLLPRGPLLAAGALVALTIAGSAWVRLTGIGRPELPESQTTQQRQLRFEDRSNGGVDVIDAATGRVAHVLQPGHDGFVRATLRTFAQERKRRGIGPQQPFVLSTHVDGRITLQDPALGRVIDLEAFGPTNAGAFARLLAPNKETP